MRDPHRRAVLLGAASLLGSAWMSRHAAAQQAVLEADPEQIYGAVEGEPFPIPAVDLARINPRFLRNYVAYDTDEPAGTIVVDPAKRFLFLTDGSGHAIRYGVGVGRQGFAWAGRAEIKFKREWPDWYPPKEMLARDHSIMEVMSNLQGGIGMPGGPGNPLGARAHYLWQGNRDTLYRIHGTIEPWTIGTSVSSGCIRMINQDVIDLYGRVEIGTKVVVLGNGGSGNEAPQRRRLRNVPDDQPDADPMMTPDPYAQPDQGY